LWEEWKKLIFERASLINIKLKLNIELRDPHDIKFLECAVNGGASFIVSGDKDLLEEEKFPNINIVSPREFLKLFR
jgi:putative PIN family toxin of toxin-antitoxin system